MIPKAYQKIFVELYKYYFLNIFFPVKCVGCGKYGVNVCSDCLNEINGFVTDTCNLCGKISKYSKYCPSCKVRLKTSLSGILVSAEYDVGPIKEMIHHLKYSGNVELVPYLGEVIVARIKDKFNSTNLIVVPVPMHAKREARRGYNQAELLARYVSKRLDLRGRVALSRIVHTHTQVGLNKKERRENLSGAFRCIDTELISQKDVLLIDDVSTTGATLDECAKVLKEAGAKRVWGVVVAKRIG